MISRWKSALAVVAVAAAAGCSGGGKAAVAATPTGPSVEVDARARGGRVPIGSEIAIAGRVRAGAASLWLDGRPVAIAADGAFAVTLAAEAGLREVRLEAVDAAGRRSAQTVAYLGGTFAPEEIPLAGGARVRLDRAAVAALAGPMGESLRLVDLGQRLAREPRSGDEASPAVGSGPRGLRGARGRLGEASVTVEPREGALAVAVTLGPIAIEMRDGAAAATFSARRAQVRVELVAGADPLGRFTVGARATAVSFTDATSAPASEVVESAIATGLGAVVAEEVSAELKRELTSLAAPQARTILDGSVVTEVFAGDRVVHDASGLSISLSTRFVAPPTRAVAGPGYLVAPGLLAPLAGGDAGVSLELSVGFFDQLLAGFHRAGRLSGTIDGPALRVLAPESPRLDGDLIRRTFPGLGDAIPPGAAVTLELRPHLPPILAVAPSKQGGGQPSLAFGDLEMAILVSGGDGSLTTALRAMAQVRVPCRLVAKGGFVRLEADPAAARVSADVLESPLGPVAAAEVDALARDLLPAIIAASVEQAGALRTPTATRSGDYR